MRFRWGALPDEQREGTRNYLILLPGADPGGGDKVPLGRAAGRAARGHPELLILLPGADPGGGDKVPLGRAAGRAARGHPELLIFTAWRRSWRR